jgi:hypothetical protein
MFENRSTGRLTFAQWPNLPLWVWIGATVLGKFVTSSIVGVVGDLGLGVWAVLEVWSGVNPWRRLLGLGALVSLAMSTFG